MREIYWVIDMKIFGVNYFVKIIGSYIEDSVGMVECFMRYVNGILVMIIFIMIMVMMMMEYVVICLLVEIE